MIADDAVFLLLVATSILSVFGMAALAIGYRSSLDSEELITRYFSRGMAAIAAVYTLRRVSWDIVVPVITGVYAEHPYINILFNILALFGVYFGLQARYYLIPAEERAGWAWWNAWLHPSRCYFSRFKKGTRR